jgi:signal transduction histidine kinase
MRAVWRRPIVQDAAMASALLAFAVGRILTAAPPSPAGPVPIALAAAQSLPLAFRRLAPVPVLGTLLAADLLSRVPTFHSDISMPAILVLLVAFYTVAAHRPPRLSVPAVGGSLLAVYVVGSAPAFRAPDLWELVMTLVPAASLWLLGDHMRRQRAGAAAVAERAAAEERRRIARELHDVVAHSVSAMVVLAGAARRVLVRDPDRAEETLAMVEETGRQALTELRRLLGLTRDLDAVLEPQPGLQQASGLLEAARALGLRVESSVRGQPRRLPPGADLSAYRILQEALTNVVRHARASRARVAIEYQPDAVLLEVCDNGCGPQRTSDGGQGHGLVGMRERLAMFGGELEAGAGDDGGFRLRARLPTGSA